MIRPYRWMVLSMLPLALLLGCGEQSPMLVSQQQEIEIGQSMVQEVYQTYGQPLRSGPYVQRLQRVAYPILQRTERDLPYQIEVLQNDELINAFALPGGPMFVTTGLMNAMDSDGELAFVIGHEIGHTEHEHGRRAINDALLANTAASVLLGGQSDIVQLGAQIGYELIRRGWSRQQEREADNTGVRLMASAGFDPRESLDALRALGAGGGGSTNWLSTHPATAERIDRIQDQLRMEYGVR